MPATPRRRGQQLLVQGLASAIAALLIAGGAAWGAGAPNEAATQAAATQQDEGKPAKAAKASAEPAKAAKPAKPAAEAAKAAKAAKPAKPAKAAKAAKGANGQGKALGHSKGAGHGNRVSAAARGEAPPVGNCRNHGHWVSTVAKGLASCNDNPRPAPNAADD